MRTSLKLAAALAAAIGCLNMAPAPAVEILTNGSLDQSVGPLGWMSNESITGETTAISLAEHVAGGQSINDLGTPALGITVQPWAGNVGALMGQNKMVNYTLEQTVTGQTANTAYMLSGDFWLEAFYSGAVEFMDPLSPSDPNGTGTVPSPTVTKMEMTFLNGTTPIGAPAVLDLRTATTLFDAWETHMLEATSPVGTTAVNVKISALDMLDNFANQGLRLDNFSLKRGTSTLERLANANLNTAGAPLGWELIEAPPGTDNSSFIGFAHRATPTAPTGQGLWVRAFEGGDFTMTQTAPAMAGGAYTFSAWTVWETGYNGDNDTFPGTATDTFMEMAFLDASSAVIGTPLVLDFDAAGMDNDMDGGNIEPEDWRQFMLNGTSPAGTASVRVAVRATGLANSGSTSPQSAFFDDFSLEGPALGVAGDFDNDLDVDGNDFLIIQRGLGTTTTGADIVTWKANYGTGGAVGAVGAVPEPASAAGAVILALAGLHAGRRRNA